MFKPHYGICICHKEQRLIVVKAGYCSEGNFEQKQAKRKSEGKKLSKSFSSYSFKESTGEAELFEKLAETREWKCFVTDEKLFELKSTQFLHVLSKALNKFPLFKTYDKNIVFGTDETHFKWDKAPRSELRKDPRWDKMFELEAELLEEYKLLKNK